MRNTSPRTCRDRQPGTSGTSRSRSSSPQRTNRCKRTTCFSIHYICLHQIGLDYPHWEKFVVEYIGSGQIRLIKMQNYHVHKRQGQNLCFVVMGSVRKETEEFTVVCILRELLNLWDKGRFD